MKRTLALNLNAFPAGFPPSLQTPGAPLTHQDTITVDLRSLCSHMYRDTFGFSSPRQNPLYALYKGMVTSNQELEFVAGALGSHKEARVSENMKMGKAFCRWFCDNHLGISHFAHMDDILGHTAPQQFQGVQVKRVAPLDTPDYLCATRNGTVCLAEAKGRQKTAISFTNAAFGQWRQQFTRVQIQNAGGVLMSVKGYIVATRFRNQSHGSRIKSTLYCEDPATRGEPLDEETQAVLHRIVFARHYSSVFDALNLPLQSAALRYGFTLTDDSPVTVGLWKCLVPPLDNLLFVGGLIPPDGPECLGWPPFWNGDTFRDLQWNPNLIAGRSVFFGLEKAQFQIVLDACRNRIETITNAATDLPLPVVLPEELSLTGDSSLVAPEAYMRLTNVVTM